MIQESRYISLALMDQDALQRLIDGKFSVISYTPEGGAQRIENMTVLERNYIASSIMKAARNAKDAREVAMATGQVIITAKQKPRAAACVEEDDLAESYVYIQPGNVITDVCIIPGPLPKHRSIDDAWES